MTHLKKVSREDPMFSGRAIYFQPILEDGSPGIPEKVADVPDNDIICDGCNNLIEDDEVYLLILQEGDEEPRIWGTQCKECVEEYYSELEVK